VTYMDRPTSVAVQGYSMGYPIEEPATGNGGVDTSRQAQLTMNLLFRLRHGDVFRFGAAP
jgi:hypothetical protein